MPIKSRRKAREVALRALYAAEISGDPLEHTIALALEEILLVSDLTEFATELATRTWENRSSLDRQISPLLRGYSLDRLAAVDRNLLRMSLAELLYFPGIPPAVTINEAIEIARKYSTAESGKFVNGVLGSALQNTDKANWDPENAPAEFQDYGPEEAPEVEEEEVEIVAEPLIAASPEAKRLARIGGWTLKTEDPPPTEKSAGDVAPSSGEPKS